MEDTQTTRDIRRLLKTFGVQADEAIRAHLEQNPGVATLRLRIVLEDLTDYGTDHPRQPLQFEVAGEVSR